MSTISVALQELLRCGANVNAATKALYTPFHIAVHLGSILVSLSALSLESVLFFLCFSSSSALSLLLCSLSLSFTLARSLARSFLRAPSLTCVCVRA